jgi:glycerate dehydrogenase
MNLVLLDGYTLNPGDLDWSPLEQFGTFTVYDRVGDRDIVELAREADILLTNKAQITREIIEQLPRVRYIGVTATGYNIVDIDAARERGIPVTNVRDYSSMAVAQQVFALVLHFTNDVARLNESVQRGDWNASPDFCYWFSPIPELAGKTMGLVGFGNIARRVADIARAFGMEVLVHRKSNRTEDLEGLRFVDEETLFRQSDVVSLHCPLTDETRHLINRDTLARMKPSAYLINTGRGPLVHEADLAEALEAGRIAGAGLDVLSVEPPREGNPLLGVRNCVITPHVAWAAVEARQRLMEKLVENIQSFLDGAPKNVVN